MKTDPVNDTTKPAQIRESKLLVRFLHIEIPLIFIAWILLTLFNLGKAYHIDDAFHLEAAQNLLENPLKPMSGMIIWGDNPSPMYTHNQPPLFFYLIAIVSAIFGMHEIVLHIFFSVFTFLLLFYFQKIIRFLPIKSKRLVFSLLVFSPIFIVNQNLMVDVPLMVCILGMCYHLLKAKYINPMANYTFSAIFLSVGLLMKYSILPLLVVLLLVIVARRDFKNLVVVLIPVLVLSLWSGWNFLEYGSVHIFDRPANDIHIYKFWAFVACLGSISVYSFSYASSLIPKKMLMIGFYLLFLIFVICSVLVYFAVIPEDDFSQYLNIAFIVNGFVVIIALLRIFITSLKTGIQDFFVSDSFVIFLFLTSLGSFIILFAPFISTRHLLLVLPFAIIFGSDLFEKARKRINRISIALTICLGLLLGISDWHYADYYRRLADSIEISEERTTWFSGLWGWKWYATQQGMKPYYPENEKIKAGDYLVFPGDVPLQPISENLQLVLERKTWEEAGLATFFSGNDFASLYNSFVNKPPWTLSVAPIDTLYVYRVAEINSVHPNQ